MDKWKPILKDIKINLVALLYSATSYRSASMNIQMRMYFIRIVYVKYIWYKEFHILQKGRSKLQMYNNIYPHINVAQV